MVDVSTSEILQVSRCYRPGEKALEDKNLARAIAQGLMIMSDRALLTPKEKEKALRAQLTLGPLAVSKVGKP